MATRGTTKKKRTSSRRSSKEKKTAIAELDFGEMLTIAQVAEWHQKLAGVFDLREPVSLNGGGIEKIDSAGLQLLVALMKEAEVSGVDIKWSAASDSLKQNASRLGLTKILHLEAL